MPNDVSTRGRDVPANERQAVAFALGAVLLWSTVATAFKLGLERVAPAQLLLLGAVASLAFFFLFTVATRRTGELLALQRRTLYHCIALGLMNPFLYYLVLFEAYRRLPAQIAQPLNYTWAVTLALLAVPLLRQRLTQRDFVGIATSYAGVALLLSQGATGVGDVDLVGVAAALASTVIWSGYWLVSVRIEAHPAVAMTVGFAAGTIAIAAVCAATTGMPSLTLPHIAFGAWVGLVEMGVTFLLWREALARTARAARIGQLIFLSPFLSFVLIATFVGERIHPMSVLGLVGIVIGLAITRRTTV